MNEKVGADKFADKIMESLEEKFEIFYNESPFVTNPKASLNPDEFKLAIKVAIHGGWYGGVNAITEILKEHGL